MAREAASIHEELRSVQAEITRLEDDVRRSGNGTTMAVLGNRRNRLRELHNDLADALKESTR